MARRGFNQRLVTTNVDARDVLRAMGKLPKEVQNEIRNTNLDNSRILAKNIRDAIGAGDPPQAKLIEDTIKPERDRLIHVNAGGSQKVGRPYRSKKSRAAGKRSVKYRAPAGALVYGAEYGSSGKSHDRKGRAMGARFVRPHNKDGYFIGPAMERFAPQLLQIWSDTIQREIRKRGLK